MADGRTRNWTFVFYPGDSAPEDWREYLERLHVSALVSPLHGSDLNGDDTEKKPHRHGVLIYDSVKSYEQVAADVAPLNGTIPIRCRSLVGTVRYLIHLDNPEKAQYDRAEVIEFGGAKFDDIVKLSQTDRHELLKQMRRFIIDNELLDFHEFVIYCDAENEEWSRALDDSCTLQITQFMKSMYLQKKRQREDAAYEREMYEATRFDKKGNERNNAD